MPDPEIPREEKSEAVEGATSTTSESNDPNYHDEGEESADKIDNPLPESKPSDSPESTPSDEVHDREEDEVALAAANPMAVPAGGAFPASSGADGQPQTKRGPGRPRKEHAGETSFGSKEDADATKKLAVYSDLPAPRKIEMVALTDLETDPVNSTVYAPSPTAAQGALAGSIKEHGVLTPLLGYRLTNGNVQIKSGHRRAKAAEAAGLTHVPMELVEPPTGTKDQELLIHANIQRDKTNEEKIREFLALRKGASERAKERQKAGGKN